MEKFLVDNPGQSHTDRQLTRTDTYGIVILYIRLVGKRAT